MKGYLMWITYGVMPNICTSIKFEIGEGKTLKKPKRGLNWDKTIHPSYLYE